MWNTDALVPIWALKHLTCPVLSSFEVIQHFYRFNNSFFFPVCYSLPSNQWEALCNLAWADHVWRRVGELVPAGNGTGDWCPHGPFSCWDIHIQGKKILLIIKWPLMSLHLHDWLELLEWFCRNSAQCGIMHPDLIGWTSVYSWYA